MPTIHIGNGLLDSAQTAAGRLRLRQLTDKGATEIKLAKSGRLAFTLDGTRYTYTVTLPRDRNELDAFEAAGTCDSPLSRALADIAAHALNQGAHGG